MAVVLAEAAKVVTPRKRLRVLTDDPDNRILECAEVGVADYIVTETKVMLKLGLYKDIRIISFWQYLDIPRHRTAR